jgi:hypothetical protein
VPDSARPARSPHRGRPSAVALTGRVDRRQTSGPDSKDRRGPCPVATARFILLVPEIPVAPCSAKRSLRRLAPGDRHRDRVGKVGVVDRFGAVGAAIDDLISQFLEPEPNALLEGIAAVVSADRNHAAPYTVPQAFEIGANTDLISAGRCSEEGTDTFTTLTGQHFAVVGWAIAARFVTVQQAIEIWRARLRSLQQRGSSYIILQTYAGMR